MKISIDRNLLLNSLSHVQSIVEKRNTIPILSNIFTVISFSNSVVKFVNDDNVDGSIAGEAYC